MELAGAHDRPTIPGVAQGLEAEMDDMVDLKPQCHQGIEIGVFVTGTITVPCALPLLAVHLEA
jgi:hypothetical protein